ncbi:MAG TPA: FGGY family carbohydrate kinase [Solirubrobacteraceae bacterium]|nr:FGGY family carbohydrate kinase [Solirubrobacteraceae bacterium]
MTEIILGLDQGTSSTRCLALDHNLEQRGAAAVAITASFPGPGLVEQDPAELLESARTAIAAALVEAGARPGEVVALGIANQTETFIVSERRSGRPVHPAIGWQDRRTAERCAELAAAGHAPAVRARTGLELDPTFPATKLAWLLDNVAGARSAAEAGELSYHDVGGWLARDLAGFDACEIGNAGRTLLCALGGESWDDELLELFQIPRALLPPIVASDELAVHAFGTAAAGAGLPVTGAGLPVTGVLGDQQASLFGLGCRRPGTSKVTLGTGAFILAQAGTSAPSPPPGVLASCAWRRRGVTSYALEGFVPVAGAALDWFAGIGVLPPAAELDALLSAAGPEDGSVACVPALQGLGTPSWDPLTRAALLGLTRATTRAQLARAVIDGVLHQVADALAAIGAEMPLATVLLDGGMSRSDWIVQRLADIAAVRVERAVRAEATAIGAAVMAGLAAGFWDGEGELPGIATDLVAEPSWAPEARADRRERWAAALALAVSWRG